MASKRKQPKKPIDSSDEALADDAFVAGILEASTFARRHQQKLVAGGVVLVLALASGLYYVSYRSNLAEQAVMELERVQQTIGLGNPDAARGELQNYVDRFGGTPYALEARLLLGELHLQAGEPEQAISALEPVRAQLRNPIALQCVSLLAAAYEQAGRTEEAVSTYRLIATEADLEFQVREALMNAGRVLANQGDFAGAQAVYQELMDEMEETDPVRGILDLRIAELVARASS